MQAVCERCQCRLCVAQTLLQACSSPARACNACRVSSPLLPLHSADVGQQDKRT